VTDQTAELPREQPPDVVLHIGTMKTGTSYLQQVLARNLTLLEADGIRYPNRTVGTGRAVRQVVADGDDAFHLDGAWSALAQESRAWPGRLVVISNELLSFVSGDVAKRVIESLRPARVTVVVTARDIARLLPSAWQNKVKHGRAWPFATYVESVMAAGPEPRGPARSFWHHHDLTSILDRWVAAVGAENVVVIPVPPSGSDPTLLWERFASVIGVDAAAYDASQDRRSNLSMGYAETELLRRVNLDLRRRLEPDAQKRLVLQYLANEVLRPDPTESDDRASAVLSPGAHDWAVRRSRELAEDVVARGVQVIGSVDELVPAPQDASDAANADGGQVSVVSDGTVRGVVALLLRIAELEGERILDGHGNPEPGPAATGRRGRGRRQVEDATVSMARPGQARRRARRAKAEAASANEAADDAGTS
jgi:hypothetical protein